MCDAARTGLPQSWASGWYKAYRHQCIVEARLSHIIIALIRPITIILCGQSIHGWSGSLDHPIIITKMIKYVIAIVLVHLPINNISAGHMSISK